MSQGFSVQLCVLLLRGIVYQLLWQQFLQSMIETFSLTITLVVR